jgi:CubicO group peptidase (beta-lactamase class C family)
VVRAHCWSIGIKASIVPFLIILTSLVVEGEQSVKSGEVAQWRTVAPEEVGLSSADLCDMFDYVRLHKVPIHSVLIVRHGNLALEAYFYPFRSGQRHDVASVTKSITSTLIGLAIDQDSIKTVDQPVQELLPEYLTGNPDDRRKKITIEHLLTMQAGWACGVAMDDPRIIVDEQLAQMRHTMDWVRFALDLPMVSEPGTRWAYCDPGCHVLSAILTKVTTTNALAFGRRALFEPLGIHDLAWPADRAGNNYGWGDLQMRPRDMAKIGQLFLQRGQWKGRQVVTEAWIERATRMHVDSQHTRGADGYGYYWWVPGAKYPGVFEAVGRGGQRITVWPAKDLVLVFNGGGFDTSLLAPFIVRAIQADAALPQNPAALSRLHDQINGAGQPPPPGLSRGSPALASRISGRSFSLAANTLDLSAFTLNFSDSAEASIDVVWQGRSEHLRIGLDGVDRFSTLSLVDLPAAAKGSWETGNTFVLRLDLAGAINNYLFKLAFSEEGKGVSVALTEQTGLNREEFSGTALP